MNTTNETTHAQAVSSTDLLGLVADIRAAVGDPTGKLMQDEFVEHCRKLREEHDWMAHLLATIRDKADLRYGKHRGLLAFSDIKDEAARSRRPNASCKRRRDDTIRYKFEEWITNSPHDREIKRWPEDETKCAWPGQYCDITTQLAWEAWQKSAFINKLPNVKMSCRPPRPPYGSGMCVTE